MKKKLSLYALIFVCTLVLSGIAFVIVEGNRNQMPVADRCGEAYSIRIKKYAAGVEFADFPDDTTFYIHNDTDTLCALTGQFREAEGGKELKYAKGSFKIWIYNADNKVIYRLNMEKLYDIYYFTNTKPLIQGNQVYGNQKLAKYLLGRIKHHNEQPAL